MLRWSVVVAAAIGAIGACGGKKDPPPADAAATVASAPVLDAAAVPADTMVGDTAAASADATSKVLAVTLRGRVGCARRADGRVRCWGRQRDGKVAPIAASPVELPGVITAVAVDISPMGALYVVTADGGVLRSFAELTALGALEELPHDGEVIDVHVVADVPYLLTRAGDAYGPLKSNPRMADVIMLRTVDDRGLALHRDGHVTAFTTTKATRLSGLTDIETLIGFGCGRRRGGELVCWDARGKRLPWNGPANIIERATGDQFRCDLTSSGVACTGWNDVGQLGTGRGADRRAPKLIDLPGKAIALAAGDRSTCALLDSGELTCWGGNDGGQLGDGTLHDRATPVVIAGLTSAKALPPSDGLREVEQSTETMSWAELGDGCKQPAALAGPADHQLPKVVSAYAYTSKGGAELWFADFQLEPGGYRAGANPARAGQHVFELRLEKRGAIDRGRYRDRGPRKARLVVRDELGATTFDKGIDLVVERADATWICGQLLAPRQPFAARIAKRLR